MPEWISTFRCLPSRITSSRRMSPGRAFATSRVNSDEVLTLTPLIDTTTSPGVSPAREDGPPGTRSEMIAPFWAPSPWASAISAVKFWIVAPI